MRSGRDAWRCEAWASLGETSERRRRRATQQRRSSNISRRNLASLPPHHNSPHLFLFALAYHRQSSHLTSPASCNKAPGIIHSVSDLEKRVHLASSQQASTPLSSVTRQLSLSPALHSSNTSTTTDLMAVCRHLACLRFHLRHITDPRSC